MIKLDIFEFDSHGIFYKKPKNLVGKMIDTSSCSNLDDDFVYRWTSSNNRKAIKRDLKLIVNKNEKMSILVISGKNSRDESFVLAQYYLLDNKLIKM